MALHTKLPRRYAANAIAMRNKLVRRAIEYGALRKKTYAWALAYGASWERTIRNGHKD